MHARRVAVLADIHGNLPALEAILADVEAAAVDRIVLNGDLADSPFPVPTPERLAALGDRAIWLRGNGNRCLSEARCGRSRHPAPRNRCDAAMGGTRDLGRPGATPGRVAAALRRAVSGLGTAGIRHATAHSDNEMFLVDSGLDHAAAAFAALDGATIVLGHCHMAHDRLFDRRRLINAGSVGMSCGHTGASWRAACRGQRPSSKPT